jgi:hypothetical protein
MRISLQFLVFGFILLSLPGTSWCGTPTPGYQKFQDIKVGSQAKDLLAQIGPVDATIDGFTYRVGSAFNFLEQAVIYRFRLEGEAAEIIVGKQSGKIVRKQLSSPKSFPALSVSAAKIALTAGLTVEEAAKAAGAPPWLWIEFAMAANATKPGDIPPLYQTYIWPDSGGQLAALVRDGKIVKAEYQAGGDSLLSSEPQPVDTAHPRIPRWLLPAPNNFATVASLESYKQYLTVNLGKSEAELQAVLGKAVSVSETKDKKDAAKITQRMHKYDITDSALNIASSYMYYFVPPAGQDALGANDGVLKQKKIFAINVANTMRPRHIGQGLQGMTMAQLEAAFGGPGRVQEQRLTADGKVATISGWGGQGAFFSIEFAEGATVGGQTSSGASGDKNEMASRYEEYVLILP